MLRSDDFLRKRRTIISNTGGDTTAMSSIVVELQRDSLNSAVAVSDLLRKALLISTKLKIPEFKTWIENELSGYRDCADLKNSIPPYRVRSGTVMAQDEWSGRWIPVLFPTAEQTNAISKVVFFDSVAETEALIQRANRTKENLRIDFSPEQQEELSRNSQNGLVMHTRFIRVEDLKGLLDAVRNEILRWSLKLEEEGIVGEGMTFSAEEQRKASAVHYNTNFYAPVGNVAQHAEHFNQTANVIQSEDLAKLVTQFSEHLNELNLDARQQQRAEVQLAILKTELSGEPDPAIVKQAAHSLRNITEGAIGSLLATAATQPGVWQWIHQLLATF